MFTVPSKFSFAELAARVRNETFDPQMFNEPCGIDFSKAQFVGAGGMACIRALITKGMKNWPAGSGMPVIHDNRDAVRYLVRMGFFSEDIPWRFSQPLAKVQAHDATGRFVPIYKATHEADTPRLSRQIVECIQGAEQEGGNTIKYAISEMIDNATQHAFSVEGALVAAQIYTKSDMVGAVIVDTGIGIFGHLSDHPLYRHLKTDSEALQEALKPNVTGAQIGSGSEQESENQGMGLSVTNEVAKRAGGHLYVWTGNALYRSTHDKVEQMPKAWPGTAIFLALPQTKAVDFTGIFKSLHRPLQKPKRVLRFG